jgi:hypothetical protein
MRALFFASFFFFIIKSAYAQTGQYVSGRVYDAKTKSAIPFATIKYGSGLQGVIAELDGSFSIPNTAGQASITRLEVSSLGYETRIVELPLKSRDIYLQPAGKTLQEVTIKPQDGKIRRILNNAIAQKDNNNPDKYDAYRCHIYYKMVVDVTLPDSIMKDTAAVSRKKAAFVSEQHLLLSETYSIRNWRSPQKLQEDVLATRLSGLKKTAFTSMVTDILPFHAYGDFIGLNGKDYHNPVAPGYGKHYRFNLADEIMDGTDTIWVISFKPKSIAGSSLSGILYIHSDGYALSQLIARAADTALKQTVRIEHQYGRLGYGDTGRRWFPKQLNYIIDREMKSDKSNYQLRIRGNSLVDSATWTTDRNFKFDKRHTVRLGAGVTDKSDSILNAVRPSELDDREKRTYTVIDSLGKEMKADKIMNHIRNLAEGRLSFGMLDFDLTRFLGYNKYENIRLGLGIQTNDRFVKWLSVGGWGGYGFGDKRWKYGGFAEVYFDKYKEFVLHAAYTDDIADPGRIRIDNDLDKNALRMFVMQRADQAKSYTISLKKKMGYWGVELSGTQQEIIPRYAYALRLNGKDYSKFEAKEGSINLRYAYAERTAPIFGSYYKLGSKYPIWYGKVSYGALSAGTLSNNYLQAVTAATWQKHINRIGTERMMIEGGRIWSDAPLPLAKLFAGNGFKYDGKSLVSLYAFGGLMTMFPYDFYTDRFMQMIYRHDFDWKLYRLESGKVPLSSAPNIGLQYGMLYGELDSRTVHQNVSVGVPNNGYQEAGVLLNNLLRLRSSTYYQSINVGYFYNFTSNFDLEKNGKIVIGLSIEL